MARNFDGIDDKIDFGNITDCNFGTAGYSVAASIKTTTSIRGTIVGKHIGGSDGGWGFDMLGTGELRLFQDETGNNAYRTSIATLNNGAWRRVGASKTAGAASGINLYIDGSVSNGTANESGPAPNVSSVGSVVMGTTPTGDDFTGEMAEVAIWNVVLTAAEFASLAKGFSPKLIRPASLVFYAPIIGRYSPERDIIGGFAGTVTGATVTSHPPVIYPLST